MDAWFIGKTLARRGLLRPGRPDRVLDQLNTLRHSGLTLAGELRAAEARDPHQTAIIDEHRGPVTFRALLKRAQRLAAGLAATRGLGERDRVGLMCRNHAGFIEAMVACSILGADAVLVNTALSAPQLATVAEEQKLRLLVHDREFARSRRPPAASGWTSPLWTASSRIPRHRSAGTAPAPAGLPPHGTRVMILDRAGRPVPTGHVGQIYVGNEMLFEGYTADHAQDLRDGLMGTGDLGHVDSRGLLYVDGRADDMVVSGGENVFPRPVEELLARLPQVREAAVVGVPDPEFGQRLAAYLVLHPGQTLTADEVREYVRHYLARFSVPRDVHFLAELPRTATGKVIPRLLHEN